MEDKYIIKLLLDRLSDKDIYNKISLKLNDKPKVREMFIKYKNKQNEIKEISKKMKFQIMEGRMKDFDEFLEFANRMKSEYRLNKDELRYLIDLTLRDDSKSVKQNRILNDNTNLNRIGVVLGFPEDMPTGGLTYKEEEQDFLDNILNIYSLSKQQHELLSKQSLLYSNDNLKDTITDSNPLTTDNFIHPVLFGLFFTKNDYLDNVILHGSIPNIIKLKYEGRVLDNQSDTMLHYNLISDMNETSKDNPIEDLMNRSFVQLNIWDNVKKMRDGFYFKSDQEAFMNSLDNIPIHSMDFMSLNDVKDADYVLRKILNTFSIRPIVVGTKINNSDNLMSNIRTIPVINVSLNLQNDMNIILRQIYGEKITNLSHTNASINLEQYTKFNHTIHVQDGSLYGSHEEIVHANEIFVMYVNRIKLNIDESKIGNWDSTLPLILPDHKTIDDTHVNYLETYTIGTQEFRLKAVIIAEYVKVKNYDNYRRLEEKLNKINNLHDPATRKKEYEELKKDIDDTMKTMENKYYDKVILGHSCITIKYKTHSPSEIETCYYYNPEGFSQEEQVLPTRIPAITQINLDGDKNSYKKKINEQGTLFIYERIAL